MNLNNLYFGRGFTGHEHINEFGLINMNGRAYDPSVGRFISPDIFINQDNNNQSYNRYSYCLNNPLKYVDPNGYEWDEYEYDIDGPGDPVWPFCIFSDYAPCNPCFDDFFTNLEAALSSDTQDLTTQDFYDDAMALVDPLGPSESLVDPFGPPESPCGSILRISIEMPGQVPLTDKMIFFYDKIVHEGNGKWYALYDPINNYLGDITVNEGYSIEFGSDGSLFYYASGWGIGVTEDNKIGLVNYSQSETTSTGFIDVYDPKKPLFAAVIVLSMYNFPLLITHLTEIPITYENVFYLLLHL